MNGQMVRLNGLILAKFVQAQGMVAENMSRESLGHSMAYTMETFEAVSSEIEQLANEAGELSHLIS